MRLEFTAAEIDYLVELLEAAHREKLHELHHTATRAYAQLLRERIALLEAMRTRIEAVRTASTA